jgi:polyhydroxyalkanoate synthesis regulator phasin
MEVGKNLAEFAQKAFYFGMGLANMAADKAAAVANQAPTQLAELRKQAQQLVNELVERGAMNADEARTFMDTVVNKKASSKEDAPSGPRPIRIDDIDETTDASGSESSTALDLTEAARLRQQISELQAELDRLKDNEDTSA